MGCQNSKLSGDLMAIPPKLRPLLWRKFEEMRRRRNVVPGKTLSNKQLLIDGCQEECGTFPASSVHESESRSIASTEESVVTSRSHEKTGQESDKKCEENEKSKSKGREEKKTEALKDEDQEENGQSNVKNDDIEIDLKAVEAVAIKEVVVAMKDEERAVEEKQDEGKDEVREGEKICPGSPSFRVYFIEALEEDEDENESKTEEKDEDDKDDNGSEKKQHGEENDDNIIVGASNEEQEAKIIKKKGNRGMRITRALCRGGPVAVKHLFSVSSCYHPSNDRDSLLTRKTST